METRFEVVFASGADELVATVRDHMAHRGVPVIGYVRAVVTRDDGKKAWIQPARRPGL